MLAFLMIQMEWHKEERNPEAAAARQKYYRPLPIEEGVNLSGEGIFVVRHRCFQRGIDILTDWDASDRLDRELRTEGAGRAFTGSEEHRHRGAGQRAKSIQKSFTAPTGWISRALPSRKSLTEDSASGGMMTVRGCRAGGAGMRKCTGRGHGLPGSSMCGMKLLLS